jgi:hypothetical protein
MPIGPLDYQDVDEISSGLSGCRRGCRARNGVRRMAEANRVGGNAFRGPVPKNKRVDIDPEEAQVREKKGEQKPVEEQEMPELLTNLDKAVSAIEGALFEVSKIRDELNARLEAGNIVVKKEAAGPEEEGA